MLACPPSPLRNLGRRVPRCSRGTIPPGWWLERLARVMHPPPPMYLHLRLQEHQHPRRRRALHSFWYFAVQGCLLAPPLAPASGRPTDKRAHPRGIISDLHTQWKLKPQGGHHASIGHALRHSLTVLMGGGWRKRRPRPRPSALCVSVSAAVVLLVDLVSAFPFFSSPSHPLLCQVSREPLGFITARNPTEPFRARAHRHTDVPTAMEKLDRPPEICTGHASVLILGKPPNCETSFPCTWFSTASSAARHNSPFSRPRGRARGDQHASVRPPTYAPRGTFGHMPLRRDD